MINGSDLEPERLTETILLLVFSHELCDEDDSKTVTEIFVCSIFYQLHIWSYLLR